MITDPTRMCELLVGLPDVLVLGIVDEIDGPLFVHVESRGARPGCSSCGVVAQVKDGPVLELFDPPCFGRQTRPIWRKRRWRCAEAECEMRS